MRSCRSVDAYEKVSRISEGTYGVVYRARDASTGAPFALKRIKMDRETEGFPLTSIREIALLLSLRHPNLVCAKEVVVGPRSLDAIFVAMELAEHDLAGVLSRRPRAFSTADAKTVLRHVLLGLEHLHSRWIVHRDVKPSNVLYTDRGVAKLCDFGLARTYGSPRRPYTPLVVTLWYRAPELLLGATDYATPVDLFSVGCLFAELLRGTPLLPGRGELDQLGRTFALLGTPSEKTWPGIRSLKGAQKLAFATAGEATKERAVQGLRKLFRRTDEPHTARHASHREGRGTHGEAYTRSSTRERNQTTHANATTSARTSTAPASSSSSSSSSPPALSDLGLDLMAGLLALCPERRLSAAEALEHSWFQESPLPTPEWLMPSFPPGV